MRVSFWGGVFVGTDGDPDVSVCNLKKKKGVVSYLLILHAMGEVKRTWYCSKITYSYDFLF